jgi:hypothetical protein
MNVSIVPVSRIFKTYLGQARIAELNSKNPVVRVQTQRDRVNISPDARAALASHNPEVLDLKAEEVEVEKVGVGDVTEKIDEVTADENFARTDFAE